MKCHKIRPSVCRHVLSWTHVAALYVHVRLISIYHMSFSAKAAAVTWAERSRPAFLSDPA